MTLSASKAAPGTVIKKFIGNEEPAQINEAPATLKQVYAVPVRPAIEYDEHGNILSEDFKHSPEGVILKATLDQLSNTIQLASKY